MVVTSQRSDGSSALSLTSVRTEMTSWRNFVSLSGAGDESKKVSSQKRHEHWGQVFMNIELNIGVRS